MELHIIDIGIVFLYLGLTVFIGFWISNKASQNLDSYFLGGRSIPWYILGVSNASGMFDITGTMWLVYLCFVYGLKSVWIPWLWPVFNQIFLMVYLSIWLRRSNVLTGAEWIKTRFGAGRSGILAHIIVVVFALVAVVGFLSYAFKGIGKFASVMLPWELTPNTYALIILGITTIYVVKGGMYSVVFTEVLQFIIMTLASFAIGIIAITQVSPEALNAVIPEGWKSPFFGWSLSLDWTGILDSVNTKIQEDGYSLFTIFFMMMLFKGLLVSVAGPAPNYDMQRILATRNVREAAKMSFGVNLALFFPRFMLISGLTILALVFFRDDMIAMGDDIDFELILPFAIKNFVPVGLMGVLVAGLIAAFMSTFAATVNAAPAYIVNDIYKRFINPHGSDKLYVRLSYAASILVVLIGISFGFMTESIDSVTQWIVSALWGGYTASNLLKWHWWRLNGYGYFWGMASGILAALVVPDAFPQLSALQGFPIILAISTVGCIAGSLMTPPDEEAVLVKFYTSIRPWGFWGPIHKKAVELDPEFRGNKDFGRDMVNVAVGIVWQLTLVIMPIYLVIRENLSFLSALIIFAITSYILKRNWYDKLPSE